MPARRYRHALALLFTLMCAPLALAHPMGNFSVNHYSKITLEHDGLRVLYLIDLAEIPTYQELQQDNLHAAADDPATLRYVTERGAEFARGLSLSLDGKTLPLQLKSSSVIFPPGAGGLPTMKMGFVYQAAYPIDRAMSASFRYTDSNYPGHNGWKEIVATGAAGSILKTSVPATDRSMELSNYPTDLLSSPPQDLNATLEVALPVPPLKPAPVIARQQPSPATALVAHPQRTPAATGVGPLAPQATRPAMSISASAYPLRANRQKTPGNRFTELIVAQRLSAWFLFTAALIAMGLGGLHALEPGHGKTIVAAYLVGSRGTARHAAMLGLIVTASHTVGVFALGAITLYASRYIVPEQLYPWLGVLSGIIIAALGGYMLLRRLTGTATDHDHANGGHWPFSQPQATQTPLRHVSLSQLLTLGITGGIIPCPAALIVLLSAFALHRIALGFFLIVAFSLGLAAVLISFGMMMVYTRRFATHLKVDGPLTRRWLPVASATFIMLLGTAVAYQGFAATTLHLSLPNITREQLGPLLFVIGLGLVLGMRHSTDADHVVAISTIVGRQRSIRGAAFIGSVWGIGHTITIFIVGSLIILFGVEIPPRLGLSMEFCVAVMLVLLGILNLTGITQKITARYTMGQELAPALVETSHRRLTFRERVLHKTIGRFGALQFFRPLVIGLVHGLAGSAAVALLVLSTIHSPLWATFYLLVFGAGTMVGMMCMTAAMAVPITYLGGRVHKVTSYLNFASGLASLCFGSFLVYQLGFLGGLFSSHPQWTPR